MLAGSAATETPPHCCKRVPGASLLLQLTPANAVVTRCCQPSRANAASTSRVQNSTDNVFRCRSLKTSCHERVPTRGDDLNSCVCAHLPLGGPVHNVVTSQHLNRSRATGCRLRCVWRNNGWKVENKERNNWKRE